MMMIQKLVSIPISTQLRKVLWSAVTSKQAFPREIPAFTNRSMKEEFPAYSEVWHLTHIFEKTIRNKTRRSGSEHG